MKDRYIEGILAAYNRVIQTIDTLDPEHENEYLNVLRKYVETYKYGYELEEAHIKKYEGICEGFKEYLKSCASYSDVVDEENNEEDNDDSTPHYVC